MKKVISLLVLAIMLAATPVLAGEMHGDIQGWVDEKANSDKYLVKSGGMLLTGVSQVIHTPFVILEGIGDGAINAKPSILCPKREMPGYVMGTIRGTFDGTYAGLEKLVAATGNVAYALIPGVGPVYVDQPAEEPAS